jgi:hypothetical protein
MSPMPMNWVSIPRAARRPPGLTPPRSQQSSSEESVLEDKYAAWPPSPTSSSSSHTPSFVGPPIRAPAGPALTLAQIEAPAPCGTHHVRFQPGAEWDHAVAPARGPVDVDLVLPHYRPRHLPAGERLRLRLAAAGPVAARIVSGLSLPL